MADVERFRHRVYDRVHAANPGSPAHARMAANPAEFERLAADPKPESKPKRAKARKSTEQEAGE